MSPSSIELISGAAINEAAHMNSAQAKLRKKSIGNTTAFLRTLRARKSVNPGNDTYFTLRNSLVRRSLSNASTLEPDSKA